MKLKRAFFAAFFLLSSALADDGGPPSETLELSVLTNLEGGLTPGQPLTLTFRLSADGKPVRLSECRCTALLYPGEPSARINPARFPLNVSADDDGLIQTTLKVGEAGRYSLVLDSRPVIPSAFAPMRATLRFNAASTGESP